MYVCIIDYRVDRYNSHTSVCVWGVYTGSRSQVKARSDRENQSARSTLIELRKKLT